MLLDLRFILGGIALMYRRAEGTVDLRFALRLCKRLRLRWQGQTASVGTSDDSRGQNRERAARIEGTTTWLVPSVLSDTLYWTAVIAQSGCWREKERQRVWGDAFLESGHFTFVPAS